jgi:hypothetical protein
VFPRWTAHCGVIGGRASLSGLAQLRMRVVRLHATTVQAVAEVGTTLHSGFARNIRQGEDHAQIPH